MLVFKSSMPGTILYISRGGLSFTPTTGVEDALVVLGFITRSDFYTRSGFTQCFMLVRTLRLIARYLYMLSKEC